MTKTNLAFECCRHQSLRCGQQKGFTTRALQYFLLVLAVQIIAHNAQAQASLIKDSVFFYTDNKNPTQFINAVKLPPRSYEKAADGHISFPIGKQFAYCFLKLEAGIPLASHVLVIDNTSLDSILIFSMQPSGAYTLLYIGGNRLPFKSAREYIWHTANVAIRTSPSIYLVCAKAVGQNINIKYELLPEAALQRRYLWHDRVVFFYAGAISLLLLVICVAGLLIKKRFLLIYVGYITCFAGWIFAHYGYTFPLLYPSIPVINNVIKPLTNLGACIFFLKLLQLTFMEQLVGNKRLLCVLRLSQTLLCAVAATMLLLLLPSDHPLLVASLMLLWHLAVLLSLPVVIVVPFWYYRTNTTAKIFSMAVLVLVITGILQVVTNFGMLYNYVLNEHGMMIASLLEITIIAVGLFYNVYAENKLKRNRVLQLEMQQSDTLKKLLTIQDTEQKRIANDLHDNIGPLLASLKINFGRILFTSDVSNQQELVVKTEAIINEAIAEIRNIAHDLMPKGLSSKGLIASLNDYAMSIGKLYRKTVQFQHSITNTIPPEKQLHIYRIICELVLNAAKHSTGNLVEITITDKSDGLHIMIFDNGKGFNKEEDLTKSFGLKSAESRISYLRGNLQLESIPGKGTKLMFNIPSTL